MTTTLDTADFAHTGPGTLAGRYMRTFWQPIFLSQDLPVRRARPIKVMNEEFTLYRGEDGRPHVVAFRCAHRSAQLSTGRVEGDCVRCLYHGWKYDPSGQCVDQPAEDVRFAAKVRVPAYPTEEYLGLIFVYLGEGDPPELPRYWQLEGEGILDTMAAGVAGSYTRRCNYFQNVENNVDEGHIFFTHDVGGYTQHGLNVDVPLIEAEETEYGLVQWGLRNTGVRRATHHLMPTMVYFRGNPIYPFETDWRDIVSWRVPIDDESHFSPVATLVHVAPQDVDQYWEARQRHAAHLASLPPAEEVAQQIIDGTLTLDDVTDRPDLILVQDHVAQISQGVSVDRATEWLGRGDLAIIQLRQIWSREMAALAEGRPLKQWRWPSGVLAESGV